MMDKFTTLIMALLILFVVIIIVGLIVDKKKTWQILQWVLMAVGAVLVGWIASKFKINIGKQFNNLIGARGKMPESVVNASGQPIGTVVEIKERNNPVRDVGVIETVDGQKINLPSGIMDKDVERVTVVGDNSYHVEIKHEKLTDIFNTDTDG